jgi:bifunctional enzyme CysN/CysC
VDGEFDDQRRLADAAVISSRPRDSSTLMNSEPTEQHGLSHDTKMSDQSTRGLTVWLTGLPGSGKTTSALALHTHLERTGRFVALLDGDELRHGISSDLGFSDQDRDESVRRAGEIALLLAQQGAIVIVSLVSPRRAARDKVRRLHEQVNQGFFEVHVSASLEVCERRDPKALYRKSRGGHLANMTGVDDPYESPILPELVLATDELSLTESIDLLTGAVLARLRDL